MAAYVLVDCEVTDPQRYETYKRLAQDAVAKFGGRYVARGGETIVLEGSVTPKRTVVMEFPDLETAQRWYHSPEYVAARHARAGAAQMTMIAVAGV